MDASYSTTFEENIPKNSDFLGYYSTVMMSYRLLPF
jgi:hypothetical protein